MIVRFVLKQKDGTETPFVPEGVLEHLPAVGDAIAVPSEEAGAGCYWVEHREWSVIGRVVKEVKVIAVATGWAGKLEDCCAEDDPPEAPSSRG
jgi:hypothetical protein